MKENDVNRILEHLDGSVEKAVEKYVNGHLRDVKTHLLAQDVKLTEMDKKIDDLKTETTPVVQDRETITRAGKFILWIGGITITILTILKLLK